MPQWKSPLPHLHTPQVYLATGCVSNVCDGSAAVFCALLSHAQAIRLPSKLPHRGTTQLPLATVCVNQLVHADSAAICCALFSHVQAIRLDPKAPLPHLGTAQVYLATGGDPTNSVSELGLVLNALPGRCCTTQQVVQVVLHSQLHSLVLYRHAGFTHTLSNLCMEVTHSLSDVLLVLLLQATLMCCGCWVGCCWCSLQ